MYRRKLISFALRHALAALVVVTTAHTGHAALDLTATSEEYAGEGIIYKRLLFKDDERTVQMELPHGWTYRGGGAARLTLIPPGKGFGEAVMEVQPLPASSAFDDVAVKALEQQALSTVPPASEAIHVVQTNQAPNGPGGRESFEVVVSYKALSYTFLRSTVFVNFPDCRLVLRMTAPEAEFQALNQTFRRTVQSWDSK